MSNWTHTGYLLKDHKTTGVDSSRVATPQGTKRSFHVIVTCSGTGVAYVNIEVSNDNVNWEIAHTMIFDTFTDSASEGDRTSVPWKYIRANVTSISGTNTTVNVNYGVAD